jgi:glucose/arabinose dehydrogenase
VWITSAALAACGFAGAQAPEFKYIKKDTREASRDATLAQYLPDVAWGPWHVCGPFDDTDFKKHNVVYPPELHIRLDETYPGKGGFNARWERLDLDGWPIINLKRYGSADHNDYAIAYLHRELISTGEATLPVEMGSDDGLKVWLNGKVLVDADVPRGLNPQDHLVTLPLRKGRNDLLVKVTQGQGQWEFQMQPVIDPHIASLLEYHLNNDFPLTPESNHYRILTIFEPKDCVLEVGGLTVMPDGRPIVTTRRGEIWIVDGAYADPPFNARFKRFASGLHEPLGALWHDGGLYVVQRGELTRLIDSDGDDRADEFHTITDQWGVSGNYHEFAFGPKLDGQGRLWVTLNVGFCGSLGKSIVPWRGWALIANRDGSITPVCGGLRSPNGLGRNAPGDMFFTDNQGDWVGTNKLSHLDFGDWHGHPAGDRWYARAKMSPPAPPDAPAAERERNFKPPAIWFPYDKMGRSASDILLDDTGGKFGPFEGQLFVGDQYSALVMRVFLEKVNGTYQGACFPFRRGFDCGVNRLCFGPDGSMFVGMTNRGWWSIGNRPWGLQRVVHTGVVPFEVKEMRAMPDGFTLTFTKPVDPGSAGSASSYALSSYTYHRFEKYGSPEIETKDHAITRAWVADDGMSVRLFIDGLRPRFVHELSLKGIRSAAEGEELLHPVGYYTLNEVPAGAPPPN